MRWAIALSISAAIVAACERSPAVQANVTGAGSASAPKQLVVGKTLLAGAGGNVFVDGAVCAAPCTLSYRAGASSTLASPDDTFQSFAVDCPGPGCIRSTSPTLTLDMKADHVVQATFRPKINYIFVTSTGQTANLGGLAGADAVCAARARAAGLGGNAWIAWLSTRTTSVLSRLGKSRGWMRTDGLPVLDSITDLTEQELFYPPRLDEFGNDIAVGSPYGFIPVWSGSDAAYGTATGHTCGDWTSTTQADGALVGNAAGGSMSWTWTGALYACQDWNLRIYCLETDYAATFDPAPPPAGSRLAFVGTLFTPAEGGSIADADAQCTKDARAAGLPGSFKALLADIGKAPISRFDTGKGPWYRTDGVPIVKSGTDLLADGGPLMVAPLDLAADGKSRASAMTMAWTGFGGADDDYTVPGTAESTCNGWSSRSSQDHGVAGIVSFTVKSFLRMPNWPIPSCDQAGRLYCLQK